MICTKSQSHYEQLAAPSVQVERARPLEADRFIPPHEPFGITPAIDPQLLDPALATNPTAASMRNRPIPEPEKRRDARTRLT